MTIDINKTYRTKAGHDVQIFTTGAPEPYPVVGIWEDNKGDWVPDKWTREGKSPVGGHYAKDDLVEVKPKRLVYVNLYDDPSKPWRWWSSHANKERAIAVAKSTAVAVGIPVYIEEEE